MTSNLVASTMSNKEEEEACLHALQLSSLSVLPMTLKAAIELGLLEILVKAKSGGCFLTAFEITKELSIANPEAPFMIDRMLSHLASYDIVVCARESQGGGARRYAAAAVCKYLTETNDGISMAPICLMSQDKVRMECWYHLKEAVLEGGTPFHRAHGKSMFNYLKGDERNERLFDTSMTSVSTVTTKLLLAKYTGFEGLRSIVDVGGGLGATLAAIISKYPNIKGINFDQPHTVVKAPTLSGIEHVGGDMFDSVPSGDAIILKWILHNWNDEQCMKLLRNCWKALKEGGKLILVESIYPETPDTSLASKWLFHLDMTMLALFSGGKERSLKEFESMAKDVGFSGFNNPICRVLSS